MWYSENLGTFSRAKSFNYDGVAYPATAFKNPEVLESATIYPLRVEKIDTRYYTQGAMTRTFADGMWTESYEAVEKDLGALKKELIKDWLDRLDSHLQRTDRFLTRSGEMATYFSKWKINPALQGWRDTVYQLFNAKMNSITEAVTFEGLVTADKIDIDVPEQPVPYEIEEGEE